MKISSEQIRADIRLAQQAKLLPNGQWVYGPEAAHDRGVWFEQTCGTSFVDAGYVTSRNYEATETAK